MENAAKIFTYDQAQQDLVLSDDKLKEAIDKVLELDFSPLKQQLMLKNDWTEELYEEIKDLYCKFLALNMRYPEKKICPTGPIDTFWHAHIVATKMYERDCNILFGKYLHHFPYFGMRGPEDKQNLEEAFNESIDLFIVHFGVDPTIGDTNARSCRPQRCP